MKQKNSEAKQVCMKREISDSWLRAAASISINFFYGTATINFRVTFQPLNQIKWTFQFYSHFNDDFIPTVAVTYN